MVLLFQRKTDGGLPLKPYFCGTFSAFLEKEAYGCQENKKQQ